jgi:tryptophan-rich sensory protein
MIGTEGCWPENLKAKKINIPNFKPMKTIVEIFNLVWPVLLILVAIAILLIPKKK